MKKLYLSLIVILLSLTLQQPLNAIPSWKIRRAKKQAEKVQKQAEKKAKEIARFEKKLQEIYSKILKEFESILKAFQKLEEAKPAEHAYYLTRLKLAFSNVIEQSPKGSFWYVAYKNAAPKVYSVFSINSPGIVAIADMCSSMAQYVSPIDKFRLITKNTLSLLVPKKQVSDMSLIKKVGNLASQLRKILIVLS